MATRKTQRRQQADNRFLTLLKAAEYFLAGRNFVSCRKYALRAQESDPSHPIPAQLIAIASVLSVPYITPDRPDYYAILNLPRFTSDISRIVSSFETLASVLNPTKNLNPFSTEAYGMILKARAVLLNTAEKILFDGELRKNQAFNRTFWTMCPYCYYIYEYDLVFQDCCLRCSNVNCRKGFHAAAIVVPPPLDVLEKGQYLCPGFLPFWCTTDNNYNEGVDREKIWFPFGPTAVPRREEAPAKAEDKAKNHFDGVAIEISEDEMESGEGFKKDKKVEFQDHGGDKKINNDNKVEFPTHVGDNKMNREERVEYCDKKINNEKDAEFQDRRVDENMINDKIIEFRGYGGDEKLKSEGERIGGNGNSNCEIVTSGNQKDNGGVANGKRARGMRRKSLAKNSKKLMGRGIKVDSNVVDLMQGDIEEEEEELSKGSERSKQTDPDFGAETMDAFKIGVNFFRGDDDVYVSLQFASEPGNGETGDS